MTDFRTAINDALEAQGVEPRQYESYISAVVRNLEREESHTITRLRSIASEYADRSTVDGILRRAGFGDTPESPRPKLSAPAGVAAPGQRDDMGLSDTELLERILRAVERVADAAEDIRDNH